MTIKKFDYSESKSANFILNSEQWELILEQWEQKESILKIEKH